MKAKEPLHTNALIHESSPYLLQHAHNPVYWQAWNKDSLEQARKQDRLLIISIGYSACHWCHVMEQESFEKDEVARIMNHNFINIKVDREERPDIDQVYMDAVQIMTGSGGWPLNIVALPDGRPVWGGTYFPKQQWKNALDQLSRLYEEQPEKMLEYAGKLQEGLQQLQLIDLPQQPTPFSREILQEVLSKWSRGFDRENGGVKGAPKFMMPVNYRFLMRLAFQEQRQELMEHVETTLTKMAYGGIYDHLGGGFSRYAVDENWHVPHFEKMLYDNAQMISLYSQAYRISKNELYKEVVLQSLDFVGRELSAPQPIFYAALDADSPNELGIPKEGAFYTWTPEALQKLLGEDMELFAAYYNINELGRWEGGHYILIRTRTDEELAREFGLTKAALKRKKEQWISTLLSSRNNRSYPGLDDKSLTSWNALMITAYLDAYTALGNQEFLDRALKTAEFLYKTQQDSRGRLRHIYKAGQSSINGFLEDYAFCIEAFLNLYETTFEGAWLNLADQLCQVSLEDFSDEPSPLLFFTSRADPALITRNHELTDNVIPASNSVMAKNLFRLSRHLDRPEYQERSSAMLQAVLPRMISYPTGFSNWMDLLLNFTHPFYELVITGKEAQRFREEISRHYLPNCLLAGSLQEEDFPLLRHRFREDRNLLYVCSHGRCELPQETPSEALDKIRFF